MAIFRFPGRLLLAALLFTSVAPAHAGVIPAALLASPTLVVNVADDCYAIGQQVAAENGGTLARASASEQGGQPVCVIVVLVPGKEGQRPRRAEIVVPRN